MSESITCGSQDLKILSTRLQASNVAPTPENEAVPNRWAIVLAGGDGKRLLPMTRFVAGDDRPKQFCALVDSDTLLEHTRKRAERSVPPERILYALTKTHSAYYQREAGIRPSQRIVQPANKGTAPPIVLGLLSIASMDKNAIVAVLPSDHHYSDESAFTAALDSAFAAAARAQGSVILFGSPARGPQTEYGWIELGKSAGDPEDDSFRVTRFYEKPPATLARRLFDSGALWNTFVMVGRVGDFLDLVNAARTGLPKAFTRDYLWSGSETHLPDWLYERIYMADFSRDILATQTHRLIAMKLGGLEWNDLGHPERVIQVLETSTQKPWWLKEWHAARIQPAAAVAFTGAAVA